MKKEIGNNLKKFQEESGLKPSDIQDMLSVSKSTYYKYIAEGIDSYEFITNFAKEYRYDLVNGKYLAEGHNVMFDVNNSDIKAVRRVLQQDKNFVIYDKNYVLLNEFGNWLESRGYEIRLLNLCDVVKSDTYNPLQYLSSDVDVCNFSKFMVNNFYKEKRTRTGMIMALNSIIFYLLKYCSASNIPIMVFAS